MLPDTARTELPVINRPMDNTALSAYMACPREYALAMMLHRRHKGRRPPLVYGAAWHRALEIHYKSGGNRDAVLLGTSISWEDHGVDSDYRTLARVLLDYDRYVKEFGPPDKEPAKTVGWPDAPLVEITSWAKGPVLMHPWAGKIDRVIHVAGQYYIEDHKTSARFDKHTFKSYELSNQMMGYTYLGRQLFPSLNVAGVRVNLAHVLTHETSFKREFFTYTPQQIDEWAENTNKWMTRLGSDITKYYELLNQGLDSYEAVWEVFPAHFGTNGCDRKYGLCVFHEVCGVGRKVRSKMLENNFEVLEWNPLEIDDDPA